MRVNSCPCCGNPLLRHARKGGLYWFCTSCWQEHPYLTTAESVPTPAKISKTKPVITVV